MERKIEGKFEKNQLRFVEGVAFWNLNENEKSLKLGKLKKKSQPIAQHNQVPNI